MKIADKIKSKFKRDFHPGLINSVLTPKNIIFTAIKDKLTGTGITRIILVFQLDSESYNLMLQNETGENVKMDITKEEISTIKKLFVNRIINKWNERYPDIEPKSLILEISIPDETIKIFINDYYDKVHKFDF
jgi:hypothetical protein